MPYEASELIRVRSTANYPLNGSHLVRPEDDLIQLIVSPGEEDEVGQETGDPLRGEERLDQGLVIRAGSFIPPVE